MTFLLNNFVELTITGLVLGAVYGLVALGYTLVYGVLQLINFAHSEVWMFGSFAAVWVTVTLGVAPGGPLITAIGVLLLALIAAMAVSGGVALLLERVAYRRLVRLDAPKLVALISAIGASFALAEFMGLRDRIADFFGLRDDLDTYVRAARDNTRFLNPLETEGVFTIGGYTVTNVDLIILVSAVVMMIALDQFIRRTRAGRGIRAVAQDAEAAALMGVNRNRIIRTTFLVGGVMAGAAALLYLMRFGVTRWNAGFLLGVKAFTAAVLGGIGNIRGALLGGFVLGLAENYGSAIVGSEWRDVVAFLLLVVILLFRPSGLLGESLGRARA
ncbi:branched-chain amino acid ABC transporter permease [Geodermatophilus sp. SYSU D00691]